MADLEAATIEYGDAFALIAEMARGFAEARNFDGVLERALGSIASHVGAEAGSLWILDDGVGELVCTTCVGPNPIVGTRLPASEGIVGKSVREKTCQTVFDVSQDPDFSGKADEASGLVTRSILCAPMSFSDQVVGAVELINKRAGDGHFTERDAEVLQILASSAGLAISNQRLAAAQVESETARRELEVAAEIQMSMLPRTFPPYPERGEFAIFASLLPAREVGGDFYDFSLMDDDRLTFGVGDVSGKGTPAALFMAKTATLLKSLARDDLSPARIMARLNDELSDRNESCMFVTLFFGVLDLKTGELVYANAGHNPPVLKRSDGRVESVAGRHGPLLGAWAGMAYAEDALQLSAGDLMVLYTDGVTEATDSEGRFFSEERLVDLLGSRRFASAEDAVHAIRASVEEFELGTLQTDDVAVLAVRLEGGGRG